jgi:hypothetical protein
MHAQGVGDYRTKATGNWTAATTWVGSLIFPTSANDGWVLESEFLKPALIIEK